MTEPPRRGSPVVAHPAVLRELTVMEVTDLGPHARRVVVGGDELGRFTRSDVTFGAFSSPGPEDHVKLVLADTPGGTPVLPHLDDGRLTWPSDPEPVRRDVSVRAFDAAAATLTLEIVRHGGPGPLAAWVDAVTVGDRVHLTGPRSSRLMPVADHFVLLGGLASLAAVARWASEAPGTSKVTVRVVVPGPADERRVGRGGGGALDLAWIHAPTETVLLDALAAVDPGADPFVFVGAENDTAKAARVFLRNELGLGTDRFRCVGYWRA